MRHHVVSFAVASVLAAGCSSGPESAGPATTASGLVVPARIVAERGGFIPEGVAYDATNDRFLTGSLTDGTIYQIRNDGGMTAVVSDKDLVSSVGIEVDEPRGRLLVANSGTFDGEGAGQAKLGVYNLSTGERLAMVDLAAVVADAPPDARYFANDVAVGDDGTAYVTDTRMNIIYRVSPSYEASVVRRFQTVEGLSLNGIVYHPSGYLLVAGGTTVYKVPLAAPEATMPVSMAEDVTGQDGMVWMADGRLAIVSNSSNRAVALMSDDDWATARIAGVATFDVQATTAAVVGDALYVVHPHFGDAEPPSLERVTFR